VLDETTIAHAVSDRRPLVETGVTAGAA
jgi:hypothetical protein